MSSVRVLAGCQAWCLSPCSILVVLPSTRFWYQRDTFFVWFLAESRRNGVFWIPSLRGHGSAILNGALA